MGNTFETELTLNTSVEKYHELSTELWNYLNENEIYPEDVYSTSEGFIVDIDGNWKSAHVQCNYLIHNFLNDNNIKAVIDVVPVSEDSGDDYFGHHIVKILSLDEDLQFKTFKESRDKMKFKTIKEDYIVEEVTSEVLSLTSELIELLSQIKSTANQLVVELEDEGDKSNANLVSVDILLGLEDSNIYDTLEDIAEEYKEGVSNE